MKLLVNSVTILNNHSAGCSGSTQSALVVKKSLFPAVAISRRASKTSTEIQIFLGLGCEVLPSHPASL